MLVMPNNTVEFPSLSGGRSRDATICTTLLPWNVDAQPEVSVTSASGSCASVVMEVLMTIK